MWDYTVASEYAQVTVRARFKQHALNGVFAVLPGGRQSPAICCFSWLILSRSNWRCSLFLSSRLESGISGSDVRRTATDTRLARRENTRLWCSQNDLCLKGYWERRLSGIYPPPPEGAHPTGDGALHCPLSIYSPGITWKQPLIHLNYQLLQLQRCGFAFWVKAWISTQAGKPKLLLDS